MTSVSDQNTTNIGQINEKEITFSKDNINHIDLTKITYMIHPKSKKKINVIGKKPYEEYYKFCNRFESLNENTYVIQYEDNTFSFYCENTDGGSWIIVNE